jgi:hypothetical protein
MKKNLNLMPLILETDIENSSMPDVIFKYRGWANKNHKAILKENSIWLSPPLGLVGNKNDELVCSLDFSKMKEPTYLKPTLEAKKSKPPK